MGHKIPFLAHLFYRVVVSLQTKCQNSVNNMKRTILFLLSVMLTMFSWAGNVTPKDALQQATKFMKERVAKGARRAPSTASTPTKTINISGLYAINIGNNDGYVIVSPDDRTETILGYADSGSIDPDNIPDNMRLWLQGYADEIARLDTHDYQSSTTATSRRTASEVKSPVAPLLQTVWSQSEPYRNLCPEYESGKKAATGCVATAIAQCLYATEMRVGSTTTATTDEIPGYTTRTRGFTIPSIPAGTEIHWSDMIADYSGEYTSEQADAVAELMYLCGVIIKMDYAENAAGESGADIYDAPKMLINCFGYNTTTQVVNRSSYSYAEWIDIMYHELRSGRPIVYGGQKTAGGGHCFVCDGYQGEDYFHINWGWGGLNNGHFKLSVLQANSEGIGGSNAAGGYCAGQMAMIGIQKATESGTVLDAKTHNCNLVLLEAEYSDNPTVDKDIEFTFTIENNGPDDYDGDIGMRVYFDEKEVGDIANMFDIPSGSIKVCKLTYTPQNAGDYTIKTYFHPTPENYLNFTNGLHLTVATGSNSTTTNNIDLTIETLTTENAEHIKDNKYDLYGNNFKTVVRVTNPSTEYDYHGIFCWKLVPQSSFSYFYYNDMNVDIAKNSYIDIPLEVNLLDWNEGIYALALSYEKNGSRIAPQFSLYFLQPAITTYDTNGIISVTRTSATSYIAPDEALVVDLTGTSVTTVSGGAANCLFISDQALTGVTNIIKKDGNDYTAENITLTDGNDFFTLVDFTASNIEFTYNCDRWADGTNGWNTIMLPFDVTSVTANGTPIDWFRSNSDTNKQFWLKEFVSDDTDVVNFDYVSGAMKANTPYLIALPGNHEGIGNDLSDKTIKFIGSGEIKKSAPSAITAGNYRFVGGTKTVNTENIYCINAAGNRFELKATGGSAAFRPFFKYGIFDRDIEMTVPSIEYLAIGDANGATGISDATHLNNKEGIESRVVFNLNGQRVTQPQKGLFIINGNKVVIK